MKIGTIVKIIKAIPQPNQDELDLNNYIGAECWVIGHWKQKDNADWIKGQIQVILPNEGVIMLNKGEYEVVL